MPKGTAGCGREPFQILVDESGSRLLSPTSELYNQISLTAFFTLRLDARLNPLSRSNG